MRETFTQTGEEVFDVKLFADYSKHLSKLVKVDKNLLAKMDDDSKTVLFYNFFKFIQEAYYEHFGVLISEEDDISDFSALLLTVDKKFAKKLQAYVHQYLFFVQQKMKNKHKYKARQRAKLEELRQEASVLSKFLSDPKTLQLVALGYADRNGNIIDYRSNEAMNVRNKGIWRLRGFMYQNNMFSGGDATDITSVPKFDPVSYKGVVKSFNPDVFYNLSNEGILNLVEGLVDGYCAMNGVRPPAVESRPFAKSGGKMTFGSYADGVDTIFINKELIERADKARATKDPTLPMRIMQTAIHEAEHKVQAMNMFREPETEEEKKLAYQMRESLKEAQKGNSDYASYLSRIEEAGARYAALRQMHNFSQQGLLDSNMNQTLQKLFIEEQTFRRQSRNQSVYKNFALSGSESEAPQRTA